MSKAILKYPFPYKAWLTLANDPDNTELKDWKELHAFIWEELELPFSDSLFVKSFNQNLHKQVNLVDNPEIGQAHLHDIIHTWGDYMHSRKRGFDREDAEEALDILEKHKVQPRVWIDHASFVGNMLHGTNKGGVPRLKDSTGHEYENFVYTLDLARQAGIYYIWNGEVTATTGQDRELDFKDKERLHGGNSLKAAVKSTLQMLPSNSGIFAEMDNRQYYKKQFPDGAELYCFRRYGTWKDADIYGLGKILAPNLIEELIASEGTCVVYTHLGKRLKESMDDMQHIPEATRDALRNLRKQFKAEKLMISPLSEMLDYLIIRDYVKVNTVKNHLNFCSDSIRFKPLTLENLNGKTFSFKKNGFSMNDIKVTIDEKAIPFKIIENSKNIFSVRFD